MMTANEDHTRRSVSGVVWNFFRVMAQTFLSLGVMIILTRVLAPEDFGLMTLAVIFTGLAELLASMGMGQAIIQRKVLSERAIRVAGSLSVLMGSLLLLLFWLLAEPAAGFFNSPRLADILKVLAVGLWFTSFAAVSRGLLMRKLEYKRLFGIELAAYSLGHGCVSVGLALAGYGVWSLVLGNVVALLVSSAALLLIVRPSMRPLWSATEARELMSFGMGVSLNSSVNYLAANADYAVIGRFMNPAVLGLYSRAYHLVTLPLTKISATLSGVLFSAYAEIQDDLERIRRGYLRVVSATALLTLPILTGFWVAGDLLIVGLFGEQWREASEVFRILCVAGMFKSIFHLAGSVVQAVGRVYAEVRRQLIYLLILIVGCWLAVPHGINGIALAVLLASVWMYVSMAQLVLSVVGGHWRDFFYAQLPGVMLSLLVLSAGLLFRWLNLNFFMLPDLAALLVLVLCSGVCCILGIFLLPGYCIGDTPAWLLARFEQRLPKGLRYNLSKTNVFKGAFEHAVKD